MQECATLADVNGLAQQFGERVRHRREELGLSQEVAARRAGISPSGWRKVEHAANIGLPERKTIRQISRVLGWNANRELHTLGLEPLTAQEQEQDPRDPGHEIRKLWSLLTDPQRWALVHTAATMVSPRQWPEYGHQDPPGSDPDDWTVIPLGTEILSRGEPAPQEPPYGDNGAEDPDNGAGATPNGAPQNGT